jgi:hypothetical protein
MSSENRVFYVVYVPEGEIGACINAMRLIALPQARQRAHITIRGPYARSQDVRPQNEQITGALVRVSDVGKFFSERQNTVFFHCSCPAFLKVWDKKDYPYNPHITIYDGGSRSFAEEIYALLSRYRVRVSFKVPELAELVTANGQQDSPLRETFDSAALEQIFGKALTLEEIDRLDERARLDLIERIGRYLTRHGVGSPVRADREQRWHDEVRAQKAPAG